MLVVLTVFYRWLRGKRQAAFDLQRTVMQEIPVTQPMMQCHSCGVYLPQDELINCEGRRYCSADHLHRVDDQGWIGDALWRVSPNQDLRPAGVRPDLAVIHHISLPPGGFSKGVCTPYIVDFFQNTLDPTLHPYFSEIADQRVSSHFLISRKGELIQFVSTEQKAWHAGLSSFLGREKCNDFSIGIELEGDGDTPFKEGQYDALAKLVNQLLVKYPALQFAGHSDIAPNRKTDPGIAFDWKKFQKKTGISVDRFPFGLTPR